MTRPVICFCVLSGVVASLMFATVQAAPSVLRKGNGPEVESLDPHKIEGVSAANVLRDLYEGLVAEGPKAELVPGAAESWTISDDQLTYTFRLRPNGRWSNGDPVTSARIARRFARLSHTPSCWRCHSCGRLRLNARMNAIRWSARCEP